jgi:hypothetical protein
VDQTVDKLAVLLFSMLTIASPATAFAFTSHNIFRHLRG